ATVAGDAPPALYQHRDRDRYEIVGEHGRGGLGRVMRVYDRELCRFVAIKELISRGHLGEVRFLREALITARLEHPGIVPIHEAGRWPDGTPFYAMKLVAGRPLRDLIAERTTVDERIALLHHVIAVADAIAYAHERRIIHRDLKPGNVIVGDFGETIVIDWGLAKDLAAGGDELSSSGRFRPGVDGGPFRGGEAHDGRLDGRLDRRSDGRPDGRSDGRSGSRIRDLTSTGSVLGTPAYMAPEQERGEPVDERADVFAIGAMLWELCALQKVPPIDIRQRHAMLRRSQIDGDLITILDKSLDPDPARRYANAGALAADLKAFKAGARIAARTYSLVDVLAHWTRRHRKLAAAALAVLALAVAGVALYVRNISAERDRTRHALVAAEQARDQAKLSEIGLLLEKDPTQALAQLKTITQRTPQHAYLMSRAMQGAAERVIPFKFKVHNVAFSPDTGELAITDSAGSLYTTNLVTGAVQLVGQDATSGLVRGDGEWWYVRRPFGAAAMITSTRPGSVAIPAPNFITEFWDDLLFTNQQLWAIHGNRELYQVKNRQLELVTDQADRYAADDHMQMICQPDHQLVVKSGQDIVLQSTCAESTSLHNMATSNGHYAAMNDFSTILIDHRKLAMPAPVSRSHELAISETGLLAIADYQGSAWFVRAGSDRVELAPRRATSPLSTAARGSFAAWGYQDGSVLVRDTETDETWELIGHPDSVSHLWIDTKTRHLVTESGKELRIWALTPSQLKLARKLPCSPEVLAPTPQLDTAAMICGTTLALWDTRSGTYTPVYTPPSSSQTFALAITSREACMAGGDNRVICSDLTSPQHTTTVRLEAHEHVTMLVACPQSRCLLAATTDGKVWRLDGSGREIFSHHQLPYKLAISSDGQLLASDGFDNEVVIYDLQRERIITRSKMQQALVTALGWEGHKLWVGSQDGALQQWAVGDHDLVLQERREFGGRVRDVRMLGRDLLVSFDPGVLQAVRPASAQAGRIEYGDVPLFIRSSADQRYLLLVGRKSTIVFDHQREQIAILPSVGRTFLDGFFMTPRELAVSVWGAIYTVDLEKLPFAPIH
ncbi:MAG TPA: serine/threonine-protein kinase, partial [Kofleriaceae bacterium]|nr:serine/threonine-protein kinase [Kofleriaceae bacterium]